MSNGLEGASPTIKANQQQEFISFSNQGFLGLKATVSNKGKGGSNSINDQTRPDPQKSFVASYAVPNSDKNSIYTHNGKH